MRGPQSHAGLCQGDAVPPQPSEPIRVERPSSQKGLFQMTNRITRFAAVALLISAAPLFAQFGPEPDFTITPAERAQVIESSIARLNEYYVFPDIAKKM